MGEEHGSGVQPLAYVNKRGDTVEVKVTRHALVRFKERWDLVFEPPKDNDYARLLHDSFGRAKQTLNLQGKHYERRLRRHGRDTLYFEHRPFTFVVQSAELRTVELSDRDKRLLNKRTPPRHKVRPDVKDVVEKKSVKRCHIGAYVRRGERGERVSFTKLGVYDTSHVGGDLRLLHQDHAFVSAVIERAEKMFPEGCSVESLYAWVKDNERVRVC